MVGLLRIIDIFSAYGKKAINGYPVLGESANPIYIRHNPFLNMPRSTVVPTLLTTLKTNMKSRILHHVLYPLSAMRHISNLDGILMLYLFPERKVCLNFRNGNTFIISGNKTEDNLWLLYKVMEKGLPIFPSKDFSHVSFQYKGKRITLRGPSCLGLCYNTFFNSEYGNHPVEGKLVIDIGANIGDTAIFYAMNGATVIACEPFPHTYRLGKKNIRMSGMSWRIRLLNVAVGASHSYMMLPDTIESTVGKLAENTENGKKIPILTLSAIVGKKNFNDALLKIDCEGAEYEILLSADNKLLRRFSTIVVEYHHGCKNIIEKLESAGFDVKRTSESRFGVQKGWKYPLIVGMLEATLIPLVPKVAGILG